MSRKLLAFIKMFVVAIGMLGLSMLLFDKTNSDKKQKLPDENPAVSAYDFAMGTSISAQIYTHKDNETLVRKQIFEKIKALDSDIISWREDDSELGLFNSTYIVDNSYEVSEELYTAIGQSLDICSESEGALDITIRPLATVWGIEASDVFIPPTDEAIKEALELVSYESIQVRELNKNLMGEIVVSKEGLIIDLGAVGKGYALDVAKGILADNEIEGAVVTVGGSIMVYGSKGDNSNWKVGVRNPNEDIYSNNMLGYLEFPPGTITCISTSGGYEKYKEYEGEIYHHILDRKTGYPAMSDLTSVTIVCDNGLVSDGLSTACYVLGYEKSLQILKKYNAEAVFATSKGEIIVTEGLKDNWIGD